VLVCSRFLSVCTENNFKIHMYVCDLVIKSVNCWLGEEGEGGGGVLGQAERVMHNIYTVRKGGKVHANVDLH
jgi:hypothetical protein